MVARKVAESALLDFSKGLEPRPHTDEELRALLMKEFGLLSRATLDNYVAFMRARGAVLAQ